MRRPAGWGSSDTLMRFCKPADEGCPSECFRAMPAAPGSEAEASSEGIVFRDDHDLVPVDFIGGDGTEGSIPCLEDNDRDHERGSEGGGEGVSIFA